MGLIRFLWLVREQRREVREPALRLVQGDWCRETGGGELHCRISADGRGCAARQFNRGAGELAFEIVFPPPLLLMSIFLDIFPSSLNNRVNPASTERKDEQHDMLRC